MNAPPVKFAVEPQSFEKMDVGVSLQVVPELSQEGQMINMLINPKVVEYLGDFDYGMKVPYIQYGMTAGVVTSAEVQYYNVEMPQPKFHVREINTYISVYNGSTVVMGGLITETRKSFEDKVPFFGDLPFIGFLFRSKGEFSEKRNLLVFLTARLVDPAGRPLKTATDGRTGNAAMDTAAETMDSIAE
jgi:general secretion pathway protein D